MPYYNENTVYYRRLTASYDDVHLPPLGDYASRRFSNPLPKPFEGDESVEFITFLPLSTSHGFETMERFQLDRPNYDIVSLRPSTYPRDDVPGTTREKRLKRNAYITGYRAIFFRTIVKIGRTIVKIGQKKRKEEAYPDTRLYSTVVYTSLQVTSRESCTVRLASTQLRRLVKLDEIASVVCSGK